MSKKVRSINFSPDEYLSGILAMHPTDVGVYWTACAIMYAGDGTIQVDDERLYRIFSVRRSVIKAAMERLIDAGKVQRNGTELTVERVWDEREAALERIRRSTEAGAKGGRPRGDIEEKQGDSKRVGLNNKKAITTTTTTTNTPIVPKGTVYTVLFEAFWNGYPNKVGKKAAFNAWKRALKKADAEMIVSGVVAYMNNKPADRDWLNPATFLNQERWLDSYGDEDSQPKISTSEQHDNWVRRVKKWHQGSEWPDFLGPAPGLDGCQAPQAAIAEGTV